MTYELLVRRHLKGWRKQTLLDRSILKLHASECGESVPKKARVRDGEDEDD